MEFENNDHKTLIQIIFFIMLIIAVISFAIIGTNINLKKNESSSAVKKIIDDIEPTVNTLKETELDKLNDGFLRALYSYTETDTDINSYFQSLSNNDKLYLGNIISINTNSKYRITFNEIRNNITNVIGNDLNVQSEDYYLGEEETPYYVYDKVTGYYTINKDYNGGTDIYTTLSSRRIYNYKIKEVVNNGEEHAIYVYGLYKNSESFIEYLENDKGMKRYINIDNMLEDFEYTETEAEYLNNLFINDIEQFMVFKYEYTLTENNSYILSEFTRIS